MSEPSDPSHETPVDRANPELYTKSWVQLELGKIKGQRKLSDPTFYRWLGLLGITPGKDYTAAQLERLKELAWHFRTGRSWKDFEQQLLEQQHEPNSDPQ